MTDSQKKALESLRIDNAVIDMLCDESMPLPRQPRFREPQLFDEIMDVAKSALTEATGGNDTWCN